jgi:crotonobetainyl-CoA:carnitine CoA-transferase CaiB-like acyl-CoA transferase
VKARGAIVEREHPTGGKVKMVGVPIAMSDTPGEVRRAAPRLGEHTDEVLRERLGLPPAEIDRLRRAGALGPGRPAAAARR